MITPGQIGAESLTPVLTDEQIMNLTLLVKQYPGYRANLGLFTDLQGELEKEQTTATVKTKGLKAVLTALGKLPSLVVESQGRSDAPAHFSTEENWASLAIDVLNLLYDFPAGLLGNQSFALTRKPLGGLIDTSELNKAQYRIRKII